MLTQRRCTITRQTRGCSSVSRCNSVIRHVPMPMNLPPPPLRLNQLPLRPPQLLLPPFPILPRHPLRPLRPLQHLLRRLPIPELRPTRLVRARSVMRPQALQISSRHSGCSTVSSRRCAVAARWAASARAQAFRASGRAAVALVRRKEAVEWERSLSVWERFGILDMLVVEIGLLSCLCGSYEVSKPRRYLPGGDAASRSRGEKARGAGAVTKDKEIKGEGDGHNTTCDLAFVRHQLITYQGDCAIKMPS